MAWKRKSLSIAGQIFLVNSIIIVKFIYSFMVYKWPVTFLNKMNKAIHNLFGRVLRIILRFARFHGLNVVCM